MWQSSLEAGKDLRCRTGSRCEWSVQPGRGTVWHGSFTEDGCYFLNPSYSLRQRASADVRMRRKGRTVKRRERSDGETDRERARRKWRMRGWQFKWRSGIKRKKKRGEDERKGRGDSLREEERETIRRIIRKWKWVFGGVGEEERQWDPEEEEREEDGMHKEWREETEEGDREVGNGKNQK